MHRVRVALLSLVVSIASYLALASPAGAICQVPGPWHRYISTITFKDPCQVFVLYSVSARTWYWYTTGPKVLMVRPLDGTNPLTAASPTRAWFEEHCYKWDPVSQGWKFDPEDPRCGGGSTHT